jgi:1-phosphatidylinositol-4-phosphate 5-kinase
MLCRVPREYILRTFDMKGSEFDREVLAKKRNADISKLTLKDLDFFKTEKKIYIRSQMADRN